MSKSSYRQLLKLTKALTLKNNNPLWVNAVTDPSQPPLKQPDLNALVSYLDACNNHKKMMELYWPVSDLTSEQKLTRTANTVGFALPEKFTDEQLGLGKKSMLDLGKE